MGIFSDFAPSYWAAGIPVMPLKKRSKAPILNEWGSYGSVAPTEAVKNHWLQTYEDNNIGLPFGEASGLCAIDIDTEDQSLVDAIMDCLPASPWTRVGRKGVGLIYRWEGQRNFKIRTSDGMICEFLGKGNQLVMPPSIHPETGRPYTSNTNLWDVVDKIQPLGADIEERLRRALGVRGVMLAHEGRSAPMVVVPAGERDIQLVRRAGYYARVVLGIDKTANFTLAEAMQHMHTWVEQFTAGAAGDDMDPEKGVAKLIEFLLKDVEAGKTLPDGWDIGLTADQLKHPSINAMQVKNEVQRWSYTRACEWLSEQEALRPNDDDWMLRKIFELIELLARDDNFTELEFNSLHKVFKRHLNKIEISKTDLKRAFRDARSQGDGKEIAEDHATIAANLLESIHRDGELRYAEGGFWQWNGSCFQELPRADLYRMVSNIKGNVLCRRHADYEAIVKTISILARKDLIEVLEPGVNFANGFLDSDGLLHEHSPKFGKTFTMPFNYAPERANEAHKWFAFLERVWGDDPDYDDKVAALQEALAATMLGEGPKYQRAILLYGKANTGKSTALNVLRAMMPPAAVSSIAPDTWNEKFSLGHMVGRTLNCCGELSDTSAIDGKAFKEIVVGEQKSAEFKGQDKFQFIPIATHWFASNFLPFSRDGTAGFLRRWLILEFNHPMQAGEVVRNFDEVLVAEEREAIAAWAMLGLPRLRARKDYTLPQSHHRRIGQVHRANNPVAAWLQDNGKIIDTGKGDDWCDAREAFDQFSWYTKDVVGRIGMNNVGFERFKQMIGELGHPYEEYRDALGVGRYKLQGLKAIVPIVALTN